MNWPHLIDAARLLAGTFGPASTPGRPRQAMLRRAVSTAYYAMFHALLQSNANTLVGSSPTAYEIELWVKTYRALDHGAATSRLSSNSSLRRIPEINNFARVFKSVQEQRISADYDPQKGFVRSEVIALIDRVEATTIAFCSIDTSTRKALANHLLIRER